MYIIQIDRIKIKKKWFLYIHEKDNNNKITNKQNINYIKIATGKLHSKTLQAMTMRVINRVKCQHELWHKFRTISPFDSWLKLGVSLSLHILSLRKRRKWFHTRTWLSYAFCFLLLLWLNDNWNVLRWRKTVYLK